MTPTLSPGSSSSVNIRWPTHLSISADLILGTVTSFNFNHEVETTMFDINYKEHAGETQIWSRTEPDPGAYIATNCIFGTAPMRVVVPDIAHLRRIPEEFDGTNPNNPCLETVYPVIHGNAIVTEVAADKKSGKISGCQYMNKATGLVRFDAHVFFESTAKFENWTMSPPRSIVSVEGVLAGVNDEGLPSLMLRRISVIGEASPQMVSALGMGGGSPGSVASKIIEARKAALQKARLNKNDGDKSKGKNKESDIEISQPTTPVSSSSNGRLVAPTEDLETPTPSLVTRKRSRAE